MVLLWGINNNSCSMHKDCIGRVVFPNETLMVGRQDVDVIIADKSVSRKHAAFQVMPEGLYLIDKESKFGSFVNGVKIEKSKQLVRGDICRFGAATIDFKIELIQFSPSFLQEESLRHFSKSKNATYLSSVNNDDSFTHLVVEQMIPTDELANAISNNPKCDLVSNWFIENLLQGHLITIGPPETLPLSSNNLSGEKIFIDSADWSVTVAFALKRMISSAGGAVVEIFTIGSIKLVPQSHQNNTSMITPQYLFRIIRDGPISSIPSSCTMEEKVFLPEKSSQNDKVVLREQNYSPNAKISGPLMCWTISSGLFRGLKGSDDDGAVNEHAQNFKRFKKVQPRSFVPCIMPVTEMRKPQEPMRSPSNNSTLLFENKPTNKLEKWLLDEPPSMPSSLKENLASLNSVQSSRFKSNLFKKLGKP